MNKAFGYLIMGLGFLLLWPLQIGLGLYALFYIVTAFLESGILAGVISIFAAAFCLWLAHMLLSVIEIPLSGLAASLLEAPTRKSTQEYDELHREDERVWGSRKDQEDRTKEVLMRFYGCKSETELIVIAGHMGLTLNELVKRVTDRYLKSVKESSSSNLLDFLRMHEPKT